MRLKALSLALGASMALALPAVAGDLREMRTTGDIEKYLEDVAISEMEKQVERPPFIMYRTMSGGAATGAPGGAAGGGASHSTTNVQVAGVDEPDHVKNDGTHIFKTAGEAVAICAAIPARSLREVGRAKVEGYASSMFLAGNTLVVFSTPQTPPAGMERPPTGNPHWGWGGPVRLMAIWPGPGGGGSYTPIVKATIFDVKDRAAPKQVREVYFEGSFVDARMVGTQVHLVSSARPNGPELTWWIDWSRQPTTQELDAIKAENRRRIRAATLEDYLPRMLDKRTSASRPRLMTGARTTFRPAISEGRNVLTLSSFDVAATAAPKSVGIIAESGELYASASALYVACYRWRYWQESQIGTEPGDQSDIHSFKIGLPTGPAYDGTGTVEGRVLNQFAMDEWNGTLRVATTTEATGQNGRPQLNHLFVLKRYWFAKKLYTIGQIRDLAPGERIYATRFIGEKGFIVTFRQVDPLFAIDMTTLTVKGELKTDGFSTYLHPVGQYHLLAVGNAADPATGRITGLDLSLFDVRDLARPRLVHRKTLPGAYSQSLYEHKAFNYFPSTQTLAIPLSDWQNGFAGLEVYDITIARGFALRGRVDHSDLARQLGWTWAPEVSRSAIIGTAIYSISDVGVKANKSSDPRVEYGSVLIRQ